MSSTHYPPAGYAIVTGAASGIGECLASRLNDYGWAVAMVDCNAEPFARMLALPKYADRDHHCTTHIIDVADEQAWRSLRTELQGKWPRLDLLVNCAGVLVGGDLCESTGQEIQRLVDVNLTGVMLGCHAMAPWMIQSGDVRPTSLGFRPGILIMSSVFAALSPPGFAVYNATKAGVLSFSESLRGELAPHGLNVTVAAPGVVRTPLLAPSGFADPAYRAAAERLLANAELTPQQVAQQALKAVERGKLYAVIGHRAQRLWWLKRLCPEWLLNRIARRAKRELGVPPLP